MEYKIIPHKLNFKFSAQTSRGVYTEHNVWYIFLYDSDGRIGIGECAPLKGLSYDYLPEKEYLFTLDRILKRIVQSKEIEEVKKELGKYPSMLFGLESALRSYKNNVVELWDSPFTEGNEHIMINSLIWMGNHDFMIQQINKKISEGCNCLKLKIGGLVLDEEVTILKYIRERFSSKQLTIRLDANGAFAPQNAIEKLDILAQFDIHSIEQPIQQGQWNDMKKIIKQSPIPIALDEELIGINALSEKQQLLEFLKPHYVILKPTLHGGFSGSEEWIDIASKNNISWWATSALESNIGLNAIAQWCATYSPTIPQGLGTGALYHNNIKMPLVLNQDKLRFNKSEVSSINQMIKEALISNSLSSLME